MNAPLLVQVMEGDAVTPAAAARKAAARARSAELICYPGGHFDVYLGERFARSVADQTEFLRRHL